MLHKSYKDINLFLNKMPSMTDKTYAKYINRWYKAEWLSLKIERGNQCEAVIDGVRCLKKKNLEFAHITPTKLKGKGRGRNQRIADVKANPDCYKLMCHGHHTLFDVKEISGIDF